MGYKEILVTVDAAPAGRARLDLAASLAERFAAHLIGLHTSVIPLPPRGGYFEYFDRSLVEPLYRGFREKVVEQAEGASALLAKLPSDAVLPPSGAWPWDIRPRPPHCTAAMSI